MAQYNLIQQIIQADISDPLQLADIITRRPELGFMYVVPRVERTHVNYSLWSIRVVENVRPDLEHSTIGPKGVTRIINGETEFTPLDRYNNQC